MRNLHVRNCTFEGTENGIRLKAERGFGGLVENLSYENITMKNVKSPIVITSYYHGLPKPGVKDASKPVDALTPIWKDIRHRQSHRHRQRRRGADHGTPGDADSESDTGKRGDLGRRSRCESAIRRARYLRM